MIRKKWLATAAVALALGLANFLAPAAHAADPVVLQWQTANLVENQFAPIWKQMVQEFEAANPSIKIEPILVARKDDWTRFVTAAQARRAPCIVETNTIPAASDGYLMPIDKYWNAAPVDFRNAWGPGVLAGSRYPGHLYCVPVWGGVYGEIYNRQMVVAAGLDPNHPPTTWDEYLTWMQKLTTPQHAGTAITAGNTDTTTRSLLSWIWSNGGEAFNADLTKATFASDPKSLAAIKFYIGLLQKGYAAPGATATNYLEQTTLFEQGKIASMRTAYWAIAKVEGDNPALKGQMIVGPPPATLPNPPVVFTQAVASVSSSCKAPDDAWKFIEFESQPKWAVMRATVADWLPLRRDLVNNPEIQKNPDMVAFLKMAQNARAYPLPTPIWADIGSIDIVNAVQQAILHPDQIDQIFKALDETLTRKLREG
jgi:ABC-type glycerol-3-phosphate transport system substrate-binding protein